MTDAIRCRFPFPEQKPAAAVFSSCAACPNAGAGAASRPQATTWSFARWLFHADIRDEYVAPLVDAAERLLAADPSICIPKAMLRVVHATMQIAPDEVPLFSDAARWAFKGLPVPSWPDGEVVGGGTWNELFREAN